MWGRFFKYLAILTLWVATPAVAEELRCPNLAGTPNLAPSPVHIEGSESHVFRTVGATEMRVHAFRPQTKKGSPKPPIVVLFFGGGWMNGTVDQLAPVARHLAERGVIAILADYRTYCRNGVGVAEELDDAKAAMIWVRRNAGTLGGDAKRVAALGGSSGGHLALGAALFGSSKSSRPDLLLLFYPCVDLTNPYELEYSAKAIGAHGRDLSPLYHLRKDMPPAYVFQGSEDPLLEENRRYCDEAKALGARCEWQLFEGAAHGFFNPAGPARARWFEPGLKALDEALTREGYL